MIVNDMFRNQNSEQNENSDAGRRMESSRPSKRRNEKPLSTKVERPTRHLTNDQRNLSTWPRHPPPPVFFVSLPLLLLLLLLQQTPTAAHNVECWLTEKSSLTPSLSQKIAFPKTEKNGVTHCSAGSHQFIHTSQMTLPAHTFVFLLTPVFCCLTNKLF